MSPRSLACILLLVLVSATGAKAADPTPVGRWTTFDDKSGKPRSVVRIWEEEGRLKGVVERFISGPGEDPEPRCTKCDGQRKDQPVVGMAVLWGLKPDGKEWSGGQILDPETREDLRVPPGANRRGRQAEDPRLPRLVDAGQDSDLVSG